jgi:hypothetical protein
VKLALLEIWGFLQVPVVWWLFRRYARRNVTGEMIASAIVGVFWEISTEPLWDYHFRVTFYRDIPVAVICGWMVMLTLITFVAKKMYCAVLGLREIRTRDKRIFIFDIIAAGLIALPMETAGAKLGVWTYRQDLLQWHWGLIPFLNMPWEIMFGYSLLMLVVPTFVRYWEAAFE